MADDRKSNIDGCLIRIEKPPPGGFSFTGRRSKARSRLGLGALLMANLIFKCLRTDMNVQHWLADEVAPRDSHKYEPVLVPTALRQQIKWQAVG